MTATAVLDATPTVRQRIRANRGFALITFVVVVVAIVMALAQSRRTAGYLDPDGVDPTGSHALATLLAEQGVTVHRVTTAAEAAAQVRAAGGLATLLVTPTAPLSERMHVVVSGEHPAHTVLLAPAQDVLTLAAPWATQAGAIGGTDEVEPGCTWPLATRTGSVPAPGAVYTANDTVPSGLVQCWQGFVLDAPESSGSGATTIVGVADAFTNAHLAESGNAALTLGVLGRDRVLVWWLPSLSDPLQFSGEDRPTIQELVPPWVSWALLQVALALLVVVWWRGRRLGRVVVEPLPVVVRATETVEGRARLYRRGHARGRAADALREGSTARLRTRLALPRGADLATVVDAVSTRTGRTPLEIDALLAPGNDPLDDASLTRLADALDNLENEVRRT